MKSISIILNQYKKECITEEEAIQLIEDLYNKPVNYNWLYPSWPQITYQPESVPLIHKYEVTCSYD